VLVSLLWWVVPGGAASASTRGTWRMMPAA